MILVRELLSSLKSNGNKDGERAILVFVSRTTTFQVHHAFLYISLPSLHVYEVKMPNFTFGGGREHTVTTFFLLS